MLLNFFAAAVLAAVRVTAAPEKHLAAREICTPDDCYRAIATDTANAEVCSSWLRVVIKPCSATATTFETTTSTEITYPLKRDVTAAPDAPLETPRDAGPCITTFTPISLDPLAYSECRAWRRTPFASRISSACSCNAISKTTTTTAYNTETTTRTGIISTTVWPTPPAWLLESSANRSLLVAADDAGAVHLTPDAAAAVPFYVHSSRQLRGLHDTSKFLIDYHRPNPNAADHQIYIHAPNVLGYRIECHEQGDWDGAFWGNCIVRGSPDGNPVVYGFSTCPNLGYTVYMTPNNAKVACTDGFAFAGWFLRPYVSG
ncbi:hypothetical protein S40288_11612 [Stachybotrys chartarum IBT 40288]|nr:hypothetical protein S40288_11612 [Stachybotrys chartarum IBT 40288]